MYNYVISFLLFLGISGIIEEFILEKLNSWTSISKIEIKKAFSFPKTIYS